MYIWIPSKEFNSQLLDLVFLSSDGRILRTSHRFLLLWIGKRIVEITSPG